MVRRILLSGLLLVLPHAAFAGDKPESRVPASPTNAGLERLKKLAGTWLVADGEGKPTDQVASVIKVTAGGSAVHETIFPGQPQEMISLYTANGPDLVMTHFCVLGNQPCLKGELDTSADRIVFRFAGGNVDPKKDRHMHEATLTFLGDDSLELKGTGWENGAPAKEMCYGLKLVRQKLQP